MAGENTNQNKDNQNEDDVEFDIVEEGTEEAKKIADEAARQASGGADQNDDEDDVEDQRLTNRPQDKAGDSKAISKSKRQRERMREKLDQKDSLIRALTQKTQQQDLRLANLEQRQGGNEVVMIDKAITDARALVEAAENAHSQSLTTNDPHLVTQAMKQLYSAQRQLENLEVAKSNYVTSRQRPQGNVNPTVTRNVNAFMARNPWFRPETNDRDSRIAKIIDDEIAAEGYDPGTSEYWTELDRRLKKQLPHRVGSKGGHREDDVEDDDDTDDTSTVDRQTETNQQNTRGRSHVSGSGQGSSQGGRKKVVLSKERVKALQDAGIWDDIPARNKMIRKYQQYDRDNQA